MVGDREHLDARSFRLGEKLRRRAIAVAVQGVGVKVDHSVDAPLPRWLSPYHAARPADQPQNRLWLARDDPSRRPAGPQDRFPSRPFPPLSPSPPGPPQNPPHPPPQGPVP